MAIYTDQFYVMDPASPPAAGAALTVVKLDINDIDNNGLVQTTGGDLVGGLAVVSVWVNDTITVVMNGVTLTITGITYYRTGGPAVFTPNDGTVLENATFVSSSWVNTSTQHPIGSFGPPCYVAGTLIATATGPRHVEHLHVDDLVLTLDHGLQPVRWIGRRSVPARGDWAPIRFMAGAVGNDRALLVSPQHRILVQGWQAELNFGLPEVLVAAKHLVNGDTIHRAPTDMVTYVHLLFDHHEVIFAEGALAESLLPGDVMLHNNPEFSDEIGRLFPELRTHSGQSRWRPARATASGAEARLLRVA